MAIWTFSHFRNLMNLAEIFLDYPSYQDFFPNFLVSGGRPEGSKLNLNFQSATWHHLKHFQRKAEGDQPVISVGAASWPG
jgi:hypothetical protein